MHVNVSALARSLRYWCSAVSNPVFPTTAYNALLHPEQQEGLSIHPNSLSRNSIHVDSFKLLATGIITNWQRCPTTVNLHALGWALSHLSTEQQRELAQRFSQTINQTLNQTINWSNSEMKDIPHNVPPEVLARLQTKLAELNQSLLDKDPQMPIHLRESHRVLISYPETVHLLDDGEIATLITGAVTHTRTEIVKAKLAPTRKAASKVTVDDL